LLEIERACKPFRNEVFFIFTVGDLDKDPPSVAAATFDTRPAVAEGYGVAGS
jgi:hypothetical protein